MSNNEPMPMSRDRASTAKASGGGPNMMLSTTAQVVLRTLLRDNDTCVVALRNDDREPFSVRVDYEDRLWDRRFTVPTPVFRRMCKLGLLECSLEYTVSPGMADDEGRRISASLISTHWRLSNVGRETAGEA